LQVRVLSDDGAPWSFVAACLLLWRSRVSGSASCAVPRTDLVWPWIWVEKNKEVVVCADLVVGEDGAGRRLFGAEWCRLPVRAGEPPDPRHRGGGAAARRHDVLVIVFVFGVQEDLLVFFFFVLDCSVRTEV
jgi:hypothetical protein